MCWVISTGKRSITGPIPATSVISACGPPVDEPIRSTRGARMLNGRRTSCGGAARGRAAASRCLSSAGANGGLGEEGAAARRTFGAEVADLLDQVVAERFGGASLTGAL